MDSFCNASVAITLLPTTILLDFFGFKPSPLMMHAGNYIAILT